VVTDRQTERHTHRQTHKATPVKTYSLAFAERTRELPGARGNARNNTRCMQVRKTMHGLDGQHPYMDKTPRGRVSQNNRGQR